MLCTPTTSLLLNLAYSVHVLYIYPYFVYFHCSNTNEMPCLVYIPSTFQEGDSFAGRRVEPAIIPNRPEAHGNVLPDGVYLGGGLLPDWHGYAVASHDSLFAGFLPGRCLRW